MARFVRVPPDVSIDGRELHVNADAVLWIEATAPPHEWNGVDYKARCVLHFAGEGELTVRETASMMGFYLNDRVVA